MRGPTRRGGPPAPLLRRQLITKRQLLTLRDAFCAGFAASGEGYNGEYPFADKGIKIEDDEVVKKAFDEWHEDANQRTS